MVSLLVAKSKSVLVTMKEILLEWTSERDTDQGSKQLEMMACSSRKGTQRAPAWEDMMVCPSCEIEETTDQRMDRLQVVALTLV